MALKYKVGDRVRIKSIDWYNENKDKDDNVVCFYSYFDKGMSKFCNKIVTIKSLHGCPNVKAFRIIEDDGYSWWSDDMIEELVKESDDFEKMCMESEKRYEEEYSTGEYCHEQSFKWGFQEGYNYSHENDKLEISLKDGYQFVDKNGNVINATKIVLEKKKKEYPKTYEECCEILGGVTAACWSGYKCGVLGSLNKLLICRDAYWKIAGEEMELGKPWEPDYKNPDVNLYVIINIYNQVEKAKYGYGFQQCVFTFPTEEMRDAFKENFKSEIEICKEFL